MKILQLLLQILTLGLYRPKQPTTDAQAETSTKHSNARNNKEKSQQKPANKTDAKKTDTKETPAKPTPAKKSSKADTKKPSEQNPEKNRDKKSQKKPKADNWTLDKFQVPAMEDKVRFHDLDLPLAVMRAIADLGFEYCSDIQAGILPHTLAGLDAIGKAQTGTGKTAAFLLSIIDRLVRNPITEKRFVGEPRSLILAPTRELALQIAKDAEGLTKYSDINTVAIVGGINYDKQRDQLENEIIDIMVATPGRLIDFIQKRAVDLQEVEILVLDEADRMLDMGFIPDVRRIIRNTPKKEYRQTLLFSATFTDEVLDLAHQWTLEPENVSIEPDQVATDTVDQRVYIVTADKKYDLLYNIIQKEHLDKLIVFANRRDETRDLQAKLKQDGISCALLSGEVPQQKRIRTLDNFKQGKIKVLVATDVAGRGIHIDGISHVVNYSLPDDPEDYVHRIGRTGRAGNTGISVSFACEDDSFQIPVIEDLLGDKLNCVYPDATLTESH